MTVAPPAASAPANAPSTTNSASCTDVSCARDAPSVRRYRGVELPLVLRRGDRCLQHEQAPGKGEQEDELDRARDLVHDRLHLPDDLAHVDRQHVRIALHELGEPSLRAGDASMRTAPR